VQGKVEAIQKAHRPKNVSELKSILGDINYYAKFLPNLATILHPLYALLHHDARWAWSEECEKAFLQIKKMLVCDNVLVHYDPSKPLVLSVDASPYGLGAVLSHQMADGSERPIAYASRTLSSAERGYAQVQREGLAIIFGVKKFHLYLYGTRFTLVTDAEPLTHIFGPKTQIPAMAAARLQRWALVLSGYSYDIVYRSSENNANADLLSRLPVRGEQEKDPEEEYVFQTVAEGLPITAKRIADGTGKDAILSKVYEYTASGWPGVCEDPELEPYWRIRHELSLDCSCLLWGRRVIIPEKLQSCILDELHEGHPGMSRMKSLGRSFVWWPGFDADVEDRVRSCNACINVQGSPKAVPLLLWPWATEPWQRIHIDYLELAGQHFLLVVDSYSKWLEVFVMDSTTASATIIALRSLFSRFGLPVEVVSDNGPQFIAQEFKDFLARNAVKHTLCPPYHPSSNGLAERHVQTFKHMYKTSGTQEVHHKVSDVLFRFRNTPHTTTGITPAELFLKRTPRTRLSLVKPCLQRKVEQTQERSKLYKDGPHPKTRTYDMYQPVRVKNMRGGKEKWIPGTVTEVRGPSTYVVRVPGNKHRLVHADHIRADDALTSNEGDGVVENENIEVPLPSGDIAPSVTVEQGLETNNPTLSASPGIPMSSPKPSASAASPSHRASPETTGRVSRFGRQVKKPNRLNI
jgi:hypothetical protein